MMIGIITTDPAGTQHDTLTPYQSPPRPTSHPVRLICVTSQALETCGARAV